MRESNGELLRVVVRADGALRYRAPHCWTAEFLAALQELEHGQEHCAAVARGDELDMRLFCADLRKQSREVWDAVDGLDPREHTGKLVSYHNWMATFASQYLGCPAGVPALASLSYFPSACCAQCQQISLACPSFTC